MLPVLDIFAGAGGLSLGLAGAGFAVTAAAEWDPDACATYAAAHPAAEVLDGDVAAMSFRRFRGEVAVLAGGPPCQPWSTGGKRLGAGDPRNGWPGFLRALAEIAPRAFLAENVAGLAAASRRPHLDALLRDLAGLGFAVTWSIVNAADYGVPQKRSRLFIVGVRDGRFAFPPPSRGPAAARPWRAAGEVLGPEPNGTAQSVGRHLRPESRPAPQPLRRARLQRRRPAHRPDPARPHPAGLDGRQQDPVG